jgi:hypothetical protein
VFAIVAFVAPDQEGWEAPSDDRTMAVADGQEVN